MYAHVATLNSNLFHQNIENVHLCAYCNTKLSPHKKSKMYVHVSILKDSKLCLYAHLKLVKLYFVACTVSTQLLW